MKLSTGGRNRNTLASDMVTNEILETCIVLLNWFDDKFKDNLAPKLIIYKIILCSPRKCYIKSLEINHFILNNHSFL